MASIIVYLRESCAQKVPLIKKWVNYIPRKGVKLEIADFIVLLLLLLVQVQLA